MLTCHYLAGLNSTTWSYSCMDIVICRCVPIILTLNICLLEILFYLNIDRNKIKYNLLVHFTMPNQWSPRNSCSVNPYVIFGKIVSDEIIREIDFFIWNVACRLRAVHFMMVIYNTLACFIDVFYILLSPKTSLNNKKSEL